MPEEPVFEVRTVSGKPLVICTLGEHVGSARIFSKGEDDARSRAEQQARAKKAAAEA